MKKYFFPIVLAGLLSLTSCGEDFLTAKPTESQQAGAPATEGAIKSNLAACYQILLFDSYANNNYNSIPFMSDLRSDDIYKGGGDASDQRQLYLLSLLEPTPQELPEGLWNIFYSGLARTNNAIIACKNAVGVSEANVNRYSAEATFLRAYYMHWLWKFWGKVPYFDEPLVAPYLAKQYSADEIYEKIISDLDYAIDDNKLPMSVSGNDLGRVTKAAAMMLRARVVMYQKDASRFAQITSDMAEIINSGAYLLMDAAQMKEGETAAPFAAMWKDQYEFCAENIFESNQLPEGKTWASGWQGYGTNLPAFISPNELKAGSEVGDFKGGWGFGPVRQSVYNIYEEGDTRREGSINAWNPDQYTPRFQNTGLFMAKYAARVGYNPQGDVDLNYANNMRIFRFAEVLLNYAELVVMHGQAEVGGVTAQSCLNQIRKRAFGRDNEIAATTENIKLERRREFLGEGMRFWDLVRWGDTNLLTESTALSTRTWEPYKKYLPIPQSEREKTVGTEFYLDQNEGYN